MRNLFVILASMMAVSSALACPGGDLVQVVLERGDQKLVAATYSKISGQRTFLSPQVQSISALMLLDESACATESCDQLKELKGRRVQFNIVMNDRTVSRKTIASLTVDPNQPVAKSSPNLGNQNSVPMIELDVHGSEIYGCSTKN